MRKLQKVIDDARKEAEKELKEGQESFDNEACKKTLSGVAGLEWAANADKPGHKAKKLFRSPLRKKLLSRCVYQGKGDVPHYGYADDPELVRARLVQEGFRGATAKLDPEDVVKELKRRAKAFVRMEGSDDNCQKTVQALLDVAGTLGKQYGLSDDTKFTMRADYDELRKNTAARCLVPVPKDNPHQEERVRVSSKKPWETQEDSSGYREIELYGTRTKRSRKLRRR
jgi:hypothetical protein